MICLFLVIVFLNTFLERDEGFLLAMLQDMSDFMEKAEPENIVFSASQRQENKRPFRC